MTTALTRIPLRLLGEDHAFAVAAPSGPSALVDVLGPARALCDQATAVVLDRYRDAGQPVSCRVGCFACCLHLVAVTLPEALDLVRRIADLPAERQAGVRARFAAALARLERAGLLEADAPPGQRLLMVEEQASHSDAVHELSRRYFRLQIPCPFLEDDRCVAYEHRPAVCREHHVVSPAEHCARPEKLLVRRVESRVEMTEALARLTGRLLAEPPRTIPLVLALEWAEANAARLAGAFDGEKLVGMLVDEIKPTFSTPEVGPPSASRSEEPSPPRSSSPNEGERERAPEVEDVVTADVAFNVAGRRLQARLTVPVGPTPLIQLLPIARRLTEASLAAAAEDAAGEGMHVSCKAGCGACCRQLVPLSLPEARRIAEQVEELPEPRRTRIKDRFEAARRRLAEAELLPALESPPPFGPGEQLPHAEAYFSLGVACPFLEDESCSIYEDRPLICREYVVVSPPERCANPGWAGVAVLGLPLQVWRAFARAAAPRPDDRVEWTPLVLAPQWSAGHPEEETPRTGPEQLQALFGELTGQTVPPPDANAGKR